MKRLDQGNHAFVSLTTVLITGPDDHATAPFLAVNRNFITAAQAVESEAESETFSSTEAEIKRWLKAAGLTAGVVEELPGDPLTVKIWTATA